MPARSFLVRGLLAGLVAGLVAFLVAFSIGEGPIDRAIEIEESGSSAEAVPHDHDDSHDDSHDETGAGAAHEHDGAAVDGTADEGHSHGDEAQVSRSTQKTWGLATATIAVGVALGGLVGLVSAAAAGRLGRMSLIGSTAVVTTIGFVSFALVPFLKYPAAPPAVGNADTIGSRTGYYFAFLLISVAAAVAAVLVARAIAARRDAYLGIVIGLLGYVVVVVIAALAMPTVNELGDFPAAVLWEFRVSSLLTLAAMWGVIGLTLTFALRSLDVARERRRALVGAAR